VSALADGFCEAARFVEFECRKSITVWADLAADLAGLVAVVCLVAAAMAAGAWRAAVLATETAGEKRAAVSPAEVAVGAEMEAATER
tara:strand:- start:163 stop:423 length:261 start_codon:yes stop_codon:yes gene_type:complete